MAVKIDKNELNEPDRLQLFFAKLRTFVAEHKARVLIVAGILVLLLVVSSGWFIYDLHYEREAQNRFFQVVEAKLNALPGQVNADQATIAGLKEVIEQYPRAKAALIAHYRLANLYASRKEYSLAIPTYEAFLAKADRDSDLTSLAHAGLGYCFEAKKAFDKALGQFEQALKTDKTHALEGLHLASIARVYEQMNNTAKAIEYYKQALDKTRDPMLSLYLKRKLALLS